LRLVEVEEVEDGDQQNRDAERGRDQPGEEEREDAEHPAEEDPAELVHLAVAEVREQRREDARVEDVFAGVRGVARLPTLRAPGSARPLVRAAVRAEDALGDVPAAVVASHRRLPRIRAGEHTGRLARVRIVLPREPLEDGVIRLREWTEADVSAIVAACGE